MVEGVQQGPVLVGTFFTPKTGPSKRHRGTTQRKPATPNQEQRPTGKRDTETCRHTPRWKKKRASSPARETGDGGTGTTRPGTGTASNRHHKAKPRHAKKKAQKTHPDNPTKKGGARPTPRPSTHAHTAHPSQERRVTSEARAQTRTPAQHPQPGGAGDHAGRAHEHTHTPTPPQGEAGRSRNPNPGTHAHTAHQNQKRRGAGGARTQPHKSHKQAET